MDVRDLKPGQAVLVDWSAERYHADTETVSRSMLEDLREDSGGGPAYFYAKHVARTLPPDRPSPAMMLGTYVHMAVLEPEDWRRRTEYGGPPEKPQRPEGADGRAKAGTDARKLYDAWQRDLEAWGAAWEDWDACRPDDLITLSVAERERVESIAKAVLEHPFAKLLMREPGSNEQTILWRHPETGLVVRLRADGIRRINDSTIVVLDLKTTSDPSPGPFARSVAKFGYHRQGAIYIDGVRALYPDDELHFVFAAVRNYAPFEVGCYELDPRDLALGRAQYLATMEDLIRRRENNDWIAEWQGWCSGITLPEWAHKEAS